MGSFGQRAPFHAVVGSVDENCRGRDLVGSFGQNAGGCFFHGGGVTDADAERRGTRRPAASQAAVKARKAFFRRDQTRPS